MKKNCWWCLVIIRQPPDERLRGKIKDDIKRVKGGVIAKYKCHLINILSISNGNNFVDPTSLK